jgi:hypothetical protein
MPGDLVEKTGVAIDGELYRHGIVGALPVRAATLAALAVVAEWLDATRPGNMVAGYASGPLAAAAIRQQIEGAAHE